MPLSLALPARRAARRAAVIALAIAGWSAGHASRADSPPRPTIAERAALAPEDSAQTVTAADLVAPAGSSRFTGKPIVRVEAVTVGRLWASEERLSARPGELYSGDVARRVARDAIAGGRFARAAVEVYGEGGGVVLRVALLPRRVIAGISLSGSVLDRAVTLDAAGLSEGGEVTAPALDLARTRIGALYASRGYPRAVVNVDATETDQPGRAVVSIEVDPGKPLIIDRRVFVMDRTMVAEVGKLRERYKIDPALNVFEELLKAVGFNMQPSERADEPALAEADRELGELLRQSGFPRADVKHKVVRRDGQAVLEVRIRSGPRVIPTFDGNRAYDADQLTAALELGKGDAARSSDLVDRLRAFYVKRGYLDVEITPSERGGDADPVHHLELHVRENRRVRVTRRVYPCLTGELSADDVGAEIETFLVEDLPRADSFSAGDPRALMQAFGPVSGGGDRPPPDLLTPGATFAPQSYDRAVKHLKDLFYSKGYMNAVIGPVSLMRARCDPRRAGEGCVPEPLPAVPARCARDALGVPEPEPALPRSMRCEPDPARGIECAPEAVVVLPIHLGPKSLLHDVAFDGNRTVSEQRLAGIAGLTLGEPVSALDVEAARLRLLDYYQSRGYAFADVRAAIEPSPDRTRARAKFSIAEHDRVTVTGFVVKGARRTDKDLILSRLALIVGRPYRQDLARQSEESIASLGTFTSVSLSLEDPDVPQANKRVIVTVSEQLPQYLDPKIGFSTGEGFRLAFEYGNRNLFGRAVSLSLRVQLSYLPDVLILDQNVREVYRADPPINKNAPLNNIGYRLERRIAASLSFPDVGLGPAFSFAVDGADIHDLQRDYGVTKDLISPSLTYRRTWRDPRAKTANQLGIQGSVSVERNDVQILSEQTTNRTYSFLRVPVGQSIAFAQRLNATYDGRDNPFAATRGILLAAGVEHVNTLALDNTLDEKGEPVEGVKQAGQQTGHFFKLTGKVTGYVPLGVPGFSAAMSLSAGGNLQLEPGSETYPDRLFFLGGGDTMRAFLADSVVPQDLAECIIAYRPTDRYCYRRDAQGDFLLDDDGNRQQLTLQDVTLRGGNLSINPRLELRFPLPVWSLLQGGVFLDAGNLWKDPARVDFLKLRWAFGLGLRVTTPIGPLALDYGFNLLRYSWEDLGAFHFSIGLF